MHIMVLPTAAVMLRSTAASLGPQAEDAEYPDQVDTLLYLLYLYCCACIADLLCPHTAAL